ncbi:hypothetical protein [Spiroplasma endosymbiont of Nomada rufipes]|uniref:hypothetical protein n=1 Tax=Spiroplasma endosymbiont of Nomada rufipes TaxID=3077933 RepID=UPI00376EE286
MPAHKKKPEDFINKQMIIRLTEKEYEEFKKYCVERNINMSSFVRSLIKNAINRKSDYNE